MLTMMIAVDGSEHSLEAVRHGLYLIGQGLRAQVVLGHVQESATLTELATVGPAAAADASVDAGMDLLAPAVALLRAAGVDHEVDVRIGDVYPTLLEIAEEHESAMILIGSTGEGALSRIFLGSVGSDLVRHSQVPVTVVKVPYTDD
ncbi:universal stress protein [Comamonas testosteroni]